MDSAKCFLKHYFSHIILGVGQGSMLAAKYMFSLGKRQKEKEN